MKQPRRLFAASTGAPRTEQGAPRTDDLGFHEEFAEGGMGPVRRGRIQRHFREAGYFDDAWLPGMIGEREAAHLDVVLGRDAKFGVGINAGAAGTKLRASLADNGFGMGNGREH